LTYAKSYQTADRGEDYFDMAIPDVMTDPAASALSELRAANLHLQATIDELRQALEAAAADAGRRVTRIQSEEAARVADLAATIIRMRDELETQRQAHDRALQADRAAAQAEIAQLRGSLDSLRVTMDGVCAAADQARATVEASHARERQALQQQIQALRDKLEQTIGGQSQ
jgi:hypothetical protein